MAIVTMRTFARLVVGVGLPVVLLPLLASVRAAWTVAGLLPTPPERGSLFDVAFGLLSLFGAGSGLFLLVGLIVFALVWARRSSEAALLVMVVAGAPLIDRLLKDLFHAPRPPTAGQVAELAPSIPVLGMLAIVALVVLLALFTRWARPAALAGLTAVALLALDRLGDRLVPVASGMDGFPSGHAVSSMALVAALVLTVWPAPRWRWTAIVLGGLFALGVGLSRVYLGAHYPADIVAGWGVALAWVTTVWALWQPALRSALSRARLLGAVPR